MSKFTPGPWEASQVDIYDEDPRRWSVLAGGGQNEATYFIATIENGLPGEIMATEEANARLIAAAPEMYAALEMFLDAQSDYETNAPDIAARKHEAALELARAALAKADGNQ